MLETVMPAIIKEGRRVMKNPSNSNYEAHTAIMWATMVAQHNIIGAGELRTGVLTT